MALSDDDRAALSAYLDGELDDDATHHLEVRLASDADLRHEYHTLRQTWGLLDFLPRATPSVELTNRTLSRVTLERRAESQSWITGLVRRVPAVTVGWAAGILLAAGVGLTLGGWLGAPAPDTTPAEEEWLRTQPHAVRTQFLALALNDRQAFMERVRGEQRAEHDAWQAAARNWNRPRPPEGAPAPVRFADLHPVDQEGVREYLIPFLSPAEHERLKQAEGKAPLYAVTLVELADAHPLALPGAVGPMFVEQLPGAIRQRLDKPVPNPFASQTRILELVRKNAAGKPWPALAIAVVENNRIYAGNLPLDRELWANNEKCLLPPMANYVQQLKAILTSKEKERLIQATNKWPDYPLAIKRLAEEHNWPRPPWATALSASPQNWNAFRAVKLINLPQPKQPAKKNAARLRHVPPERVEARLHDFGKLLFMHTKKLGNAHGQVRDRERRPWQHD